MDATTGTLAVRRADLAGPDAAEVGRLISDYLLQTEREKAQHLGTGESVAALPARYADEAGDPARVYAHATVHLAELGPRAVGVAVVHERADSIEIKRVWVDAAARGQRAGGALLDAAVSGHDLPIRLSVWDWRDPAIRLYRSRGFVIVPSWEARPRLICMERLTPG